MALRDGHASRGLSTLRCCVLALILATAGCENHAAPDTSGDEATKSAEEARRAAEDARIAAEEARKAAEAECITKALNEAVLSPENVTATLSSMMGQRLEGCPNDFTQGFVKLRTAVRDYAQTLTVIEAHKRDEDPAVNRDILNLGCSLFTGSQCASSSIKGWMEDDQALKARDANNRAAIQSAYDELEAVAAGHGVYVHNATPSPSPTPSVSPTSVMIR